MTKQLLKSGGNILRVGNSGIAYYEAPPPPGFPANDDFSGLGDNSGVVGDANWNRRWAWQENAYTSYGTEPTFTITGSKLNISTGAVSTNGELFIDFSFLTGDFTVSMDYEVVQMIGDDFPGSAGIGVGIIDSSNNYHFMNRIHFNFGGNYYGEGDSGISQATSDTANTLIVKRVGNNFSFCVGNDSNVITTASTSSSVAKFIIRINNIIGNAYEVNVDNFTLVDGVGDPIDIP